MDAHVDRLRAGRLFFAHHHLTGSAWGQPAVHPFPERAAAVAAAGSTGIGFDAQELTQLVAEHSADWVRDVLATHGLRIGELEVLTWWWGTRDDADASRPMAESMFALADEFGIGRLKASAVFLQAGDRPPLETLAERFAVLCDRAAEHGLRIALEPVAAFPYFGYADAAQVVLDADRPNGGVEIDAWHFFRDPDGFAALDRLEGRHITGLELCDGVAEPQVSLMEDSADGRLLPGTGSFDLRRLLGEIERKRPDVDLSVEVLSAPLRTLSPAENTKQTVAAVDALLDRR
ncbi:MULTISPECIES: sugar phosphate isomerase/epimerase family protein [unclassified Streptomyces]|uniref:sugar phosphate isomerase/epimerase family protein n=1 Tax=unclassified Streptomyces TaxID=2593676 RepID=UPI0035DF7574